MLRRRHRTCVDCQRHWLSPYHGLPRSKETQVSDRAGKVLILSPHVMTAALVGWYVELARLEPAYADPGEHPDQAVARVKPILVLLIDSELEAGLSDLL